MFKKFDVPFKPPFSRRVKIFRYTKNHLLYGVDKHFQKELYLPAILQEFLYPQTRSTWTLYNKIRGNAWVWLFDRAPKDGRRRVASLSVHSVYKNRLIHPRRWREGAVNRVNRNLVSGMHHEPTHHAQTTRQHARAQSTYCQHLLQEPSFQSRQVFEFNIIYGGVTATSWKNSQGHYETLLWKPIKVSPVYCVNFLFGSFSK